MRKGTLFLTVVLTTFMLAVLVAGTSAYQSLTKTEGKAAQPAEAAVVMDTSAALPPDVAAFTPEQAAALAAQVIGRTDLFSVETADLNGVSTYMVTFSSGDVVYVSPEGQILSITKIVPEVVMASVPGFGGSGSSETASSQQPSFQTGEHEEEHEEEHKEEEHQEEHEEEHESEHE